MLEKRKLTAKDFQLFTLVGEPQFSPDGKEILFIKQETCLDDNKNYSTLWIADVNNDHLEPLTHGKKNDRWARWSPDGQRIAFVSDRRGRNEIWLLNRKGGEAFNLQVDVALNSAPVWSPDGEKLVFTGAAFSKAEDWQPYKGAPDGDIERAKAQAKQRLTGDKDAAKSFSDVKVITRLRHKLDGVGDFGDVRSHVYVIDAPPYSSVKPRYTQLTDEDYDHTNPAWSPDSQHVIFTANRREDADYHYAQDIWKIDVATKAKTQMLESTGSVAALSYSPDGQWVTFVGNDGAYEISTSPNLWMIPAQGDLPIHHKQAIKLTKTLDRPVGNVPSRDMGYGTSTLPYSWSPDGSMIHFIFGDQGSSKIAKLDLKTQGIEIIWQDPLRVASGFDVIDDSYVFCIGSPDRADDIYLYQGQVEKQKTQFNKALYKELALGNTHRFTYKGDTQWDIDGWLLTPPDWDGKSALPTTVFIHGGPHGAYTSCMMFQAQLLASNGIAVLYTNPRGSQTYGQEFAYAVVKDWGGHDYHDIMKGVDYVVDQGIADPKRLGVTGWSYGGYMTCWIVTQTQRFKAAMAGACISNLHSFYGTSDIGYYFGEKQGGGKPWEEPIKLLERSAIHYMDNVTTPVLLIHGEGDLRCPIEQTDQFFVALLRQGKEVVMVRYPKEYHTIKQPKRKADHHSRVLAWFDHYLK